MYKDGVLTINDWTKGMADSAYTGFSNMSNCEVFETPGIFKMGNRTTPKTSTTFGGVGVAYIEDQYGNYYLLTSDGKCYKNGNTIIQSGLGIAWDLAIYNDYLLVTHSTVVSAYGPLSSGGASWHGNIITGLTGSYYKKMTSFKNSTIYITNGQNIGWLSALPTAAVGVAPTPTFNSALITLPDGEAATTIAPIGAYLVIGTQAANGSWFNSTNSNVANLYLFDGVGVGGSVNSLISSLNECAVQAMISNGNNLYVMAGVKGNLYLTNTSSCRKIKRIPWSPNKLFNATIRVYPNAININSYGNLLVGLTTLTSSFSNDEVKLGVYEVSLTENYPTVFKYQISSGNKGVTQPIKIGCVATNSTDAVFIAWEDGNTWGFDETDYRTYSGGVVVFESELYQIGTRNKRKTFQHLEFLLGKLLVTGQEIKLYYRKNLTDAYTLWKTYNYAGLGAVISHDDGATLADVQTVQLKITLAQPTNASVGSNIELMSLMIW